MAWMKILYYRTRPEFVEVMPGDVFVLGYRRTSYLLFNRFILLFGNTFL